MSAAPRPGPSRRYVGTPATERAQGRCAYCALPSQAPACGRPCKKALAKHTRKIDPARIRREWEDDVDAEAKECRAIVEAQARRHR